MKNIITILSIVLIFGCSSKKQIAAVQINNPTPPTEKPNYLLKKPTSNILGTLILFGGYPENPEDIIREFEIDSLANQNGIAILYSKFNRRLWLEEKEKKDLKIILEEAFKINNLPTKNITIGGFSSGGNVSLLLSNYLVTENSKIKPDRLFIIDSPVDLLELYRCSQRNIKRNFMKGSVQESQSTVSRFDKYFGNTHDGIDKYEIHSPYSFNSGNINNLVSLKDIQIRMYTEPDTIWWQENRRNNYKDMNAFYIKQLSQELENKFQSGKVELIETVNRGYRKNGYRHPHSWSIVDKEELVKWMLNK